MYTCNHPPIAMRFMRFNTFSPGMFLYMSCYRVEVSGSDVARKFAPALKRLTRCIHSQLHILLGTCMHGQVQKCTRSQPCTCSMYDVLCRSIQVLPFTGIRFACPANGMVAPKDWDLLNSHARD